MNLNHDLLSKLIGLIRYANAMEKLSVEFRSEIFLLEKEIKGMLKNHWSYIMLHHSLTKDGATVSWQTIRRYHKSPRIDGAIVSAEEYDRRFSAHDGKLFEFPWKDIGYHFGIELINDQYEILIGRNLDQEGAHCVGMNNKAVGICFIGNFDEAPVPLEQWNKGVIFVASLCKLLDIPQSFIVGHRDYAPKSCPGKFFEIEQFRKAVFCEL